MEKDEFFIKRIRELANLSYQRDIVTFSDFLNLNEQNIINDRKNQMPGVVVECFGGYEQAERQMAAFHPDALLFPWKYPICCLKVEPLAAKFSEELTHRDYLGAIMNLGIERSMVGDIVLQDGTAGAFVMEKMSRYLAENLTMIRHTSVLTEITADFSELPEPETEELSGTVSSVRLDSITALCGRLSRTKAASLIEGEKVSVNGAVCTNVSLNLRGGEILSIRGIGKFRFGEPGNLTKKGRISVVVYRYK